MNKQNLSASSWKILLISLALVYLSFSIWATTYWERLTPAKAGTLAVEFGEPDSDYRLPIVAIAADSPLAKVGAKLGDKVYFENYIDIKRQLGTDELIGLTLFDNEQSRHVALKPIAYSEFALYPIAAGADAVMAWVCNYTALLIALLIGLRRSDNGTMRVFAFMMLSFSPQTFIWYLPGGALPELFMKVILPLNYAAYYISLVYFAFTFPDDRPAHFRLPAVRRIFTLFSVVVLMYAAWYIADAFRILPLTARGRISINAFKMMVQTITISLSLLALWYSWRHSVGVIRRKLAWIGICMGGVVVALSAATIATAFGALFDPRFGICQDTVTFFCYVGLGYSILRHSLFDLGFAINRALVVTIISALLLVVFGVTEWGVDKLLHFEGREKNVIFDAVVALGIILCFHRIQHWVSHQVNHLFFHHWHKAAEQLRQFLDKAEHISDIDVLQTRFSREVSAYADISGVAIYLLRADLDYALQHVTLANAPVTIDKNNDAIVDVRHTRRMVDLISNDHGLPGQLVFPMIVRGQINGVLLLGQKLNGSQYRPDEIELLAVATHQLGLHMESLRVENLERHSTVLETQLKTERAAHERETTLLRQIIGDTRELKPAVL
ncbi:GAF domain-containing protein [Rugamonas sp.]|uniref:GAF domain-containing protein n=1 Tax=Rugamonas sp. TaxID=1926287 RepID=UPI0025D9FBDE|nr:GAF domain-containing protein [Rugamonas sp.]